MFPAGVQLTTERMGLLSFTRPEDPRGAQDQQDPGRNIDRHGQDIIDFSAGGLAFSIEEKGTGPGRHPGKDEFDRQEDLAQKSRGGKAVEQDQDRIHGERIWGNKNSHRIVPGWLRLKWDNAGRA